MIKNFKLLIVLCTLSFYGFSQASYYKLLDKDTTTWQHFGDILGVRPAQQSNFFIEPYVNSLACMDTISFSGITYRKMYHLSSVPPTINYSFKQLIGFLREDTIGRKVYYKENSSSSDQLLYDFSLSVNDSIYLSFPNYIADNGYYKVDSIVSKTELCGVRRHFYFRKHINNNNPLFNYFEHVEGIGNTYHFFYLFNGGVMPSWFPTNNSCYHPWGYGLACKHNNLIKQYQSCTSSFFYWNVNIDQCSYWYVSGNILKNELLTNLDLFPNPSNNNLTITLNAAKSLNLNIEITDLSGRSLRSIQNRSVTSGNSQITIDISNLNTGVYILTVDSESGISTRLFTVLH